MSSSMNYFSWFDFPACCKNMSLLDYLIYVLFCRSHGPGDDVSEFSGPLELIQNDPSLLVWSNLRVQNYRRVWNGAFISACCRLWQGLADFALCAIIGSLIPYGCRVVGVATGGPRVELMRLHMLSNSKVLLDVLHSLACISQLVADYYFTSCKFASLVA